MNRFNVINNILYVFFSDIELRCKLAAYQFIGIVPKIVKNGDVRVKFYTSYNGIYIYIYIYIYYIYIHTIAVLWGMASYCVVMMFP